MNSVGKSSIVPLGLRAAGAIPYRTDCRNDEKVYMRSERPAIRVDSPGVVV